MRFPHRLFLTVSGIVAAALVGSFVIRRGDGAALWLPLGLSIASLAVAILSAFKNELFEFAPAVLGSQVIFVQARPIHAKLTVILPLSFINTGYAEGVIEWVAVKLVRRTDRQSAVLHPTLEVDMLKFWQGKHYLHADNTIGLFTSFPLESKKVVVKAILFTVPTAAEPFSLSEGEYRFDIYLKASIAKRAKVMHSLTYTFSEQFLTEYISGKTMVLGDLGIRL
jgi:hypothetical protein